MQQGSPSPDAEQPEDNPYAPPSVELRLAADEKETDPFRRQRQDHRRRESSIRISGLISLILAVIVILTFGLGTISELQKPDVSGEGGIEPWMHQRWIVRMTSVLSLAAIAAVTSWGFHCLRNWGRWLLTTVVTLPVPLLLCTWLVLKRAANQGLEASADPEGLIIVAVVSALFSLPSLFLMWSPKGRIIFTPGYRETIFRTPDLRPGWSGILLALLVVPAAIASYVVLVMTVLLILAMFGLIRSI